MAELIPSNLGDDFVGTERLHDYTWIFAIDIIFAFAAAYGIGATQFLSVLPLQFNLAAYVFFFCNELKQRFMFIFLHVSIGKIIPVCRACLTSPEWYQCHHETKRAHHVTINVFEHITSRLNEHRAFYGLSH